MDRNWNLDILGDIFSNHKMIFDVLWHYIIPSLNGLKFEYFSLTVKLYYAGYLNTPRILSNWQDFG